MEDIKAFLQRLTSKGYSLHDALLLRNALEGEAKYPQDFKREDGYLICKPSGRKAKLEQGT